MNTHSGVTVAAAKVGRIVSLAHEAREIAEPDACLAHALTGICALTGADVGAIFVFDSPQPVVPRTGFIHGYSPSMTLAVIADYASQDVGFDLMAERLRARFDGTGQVVRRRRELLDNRTWYNSSFVNDSKRRWGVDDCIYSLQGIGPACFGLGINRAFGSTPFSAQERVLIEVFNLAMTTVAARCLLPQAPSANEIRRAALAPRARDTLDCLLRGASRKDVAEQLRISPNTVHHYSKIVFRAFGVGSRSELLATWFAD
jgi:DNA-binding CsgD family transcriptional regulator